MKNKQLIYQLPATYRDIENLVNDLIERYIPERIISFGCIINTTHSSGCFVDSFNDQQNHYYLLIVTQGPNRQQHMIQDYVNSHFHKGSVTVLAHSKDRVFDGINIEKNYFFNVVYRTGVVLYRADGLIFQNDQLPDLDTKHRLTIAEKYYERRDVMAKGFIQSARECLNSENYNVAVFLLHQAMEQASIETIRVFIAYRSDIHNLNRLLDLCLCFLKKDDIYPRKTKSQKRLLKILIDSYSDSRYSTDFIVSQEDAEQIYKYVTAFVNLVDTLCLNKLNELKAELEPIISSGEKVSSDTESNINS
jgi:HEPN domain-containing protein